MKNQLFVLIFILFYNCQSENKKDDLELEILTESLIAYCLDGDCSKTSNYLKEHQNKSRNLIEFKITNTTKTTYAVIPVCDNSGGIGCTVFNTFPTDNKNLGFSNLIIIDDETNNVLTYSSPLVYYAENNIGIYELIKDSLEFDYYDKIKLKEKSWNWKRVNMEIIKKTIIIHPNETLFFSSYLTLPNNIGDTNKNLQKLELNFNKSYKAQLYFASNLDTIENYLTSSQKATFKANNYVHYKKPLISANSIPIKLKK